MGQGIAVVYLYNSIYTLPLSLIWCSSYYISTPHMGQNPFRRSAHPFPSHFPVHRAWLGRILPSHAACTPPRERRRSRARRPRREESFRQRAHAMAAAAPTMDAANAAHRGGRETGGERDEGGGGEGRRDSGGSEAEDGPVQRHAGCCRLTPSLSQPAPSQQYKGTATARSSSASPASPWYQRPTVSFVQRFLSVSLELLTLLELWSVVAEQVRRGLSRRQRRSLHSRDSSRPYVLRVQIAHHPTFSRTVRVFSQKGKCCWPWSGVSPRGNCELFTIAKLGRLPLRHSPRPSASCLRSAATLSTAVFSLYQTRDGSAAIAGRCRRRLHTLRFVRMSPSSTRSATDHVRVGGGRRRCRASLLTKTTCGLAARTLLRCSTRECCFVL